MKKRTILTIAVYAVFAVLALLCFKIAIMCVKHGRDVAVSLWALLPAISMVCAFVLPNINSKLLWLHPIVLTTIAVLIGINFGMRYDTAVLYFFVAYELLASAIGSGVASIYKQRKELKKSKV